MQWHGVLGKSAQSAGKAVHYGLGIAPGAIYGAYRDSIPGPSAVRGLGYGLALFLFQDEFVNSAVGTAAKPGEYPWQAHARGLVAHLALGLATEMALNGMNRLSGGDSSSRKHAEPTG